jgi:hypothetical protein
MQRSFVTTKEGVAMANAVGLPLTVSRVNKDRALQRGPREAGKYGPTFLYRPADFLEYARRRAGVVDEETAA